MTLEEAIRSQCHGDCTEKMGQYCEATAFSWKTGDSFDPDRGNYRKRRGGSFQERSDRHVRG